MYPNDVTQMQASHEAQVRCKCAKLPNSELTSDNRPMGTDNVHVWCGGGHGEVRKAQIA